MRARTIGLSATLVGLLSLNSGAVVRPKGAEPPIVAAAAAPRAHRTLAWDQSARLARRGLPGWKGVYDHDTNVPLRLWGKTSPIAGATADAAIAEAHARAFLQAHVDTLAPGASASDFTPLANVLSHGTRTVSFAQRVQGVRV
ncbi:MAG: hypothetical protein NT062_23000, partial [Proteobacteria bacterium]|nr:hypothetical protein [Pseudomonadota bacterium]